MYVIIVKACINNLSVCIILYYLLMPCLNTGKLIKNEKKHIFYTYEYKL